MERDCIKYGDHIFLRTKDVQTPQYLAGRSVIESKVYLLKSMKEDALAEYPNSSELVFTVHPKFFFEAFKKYQKFRETKEENKMESEYVQQKLIMLQKRVEAEKKQNDNRI